MTKQFSHIRFGWTIVIACIFLAACATSIPINGTPENDPTNMASTATFEKEPPVEEPSRASTPISLPRATAHMQEGSSSSAIESGAIPATATFAPNPTSTPEWPEACKPFPDHIIHLKDYTGLGAAICKGELVSFSAPIEDGSPSDIGPWDYTARTGRIAFGKKGGEEPGLWVYDFWTGTTVKWFDDLLLGEVRWSPIRNNRGVQPLALVLQDRTLALIAGPEQMMTLENEIETFSWSPLGDQIAFVKNESLYTIPANGGHARLLARGVSGVPIWSIEENAIFIVTTPSRYIELGQGREVDEDYPGAKVALRDHPYKIAKLDGSGSFFPSIPDGITPSEELECMNTEILWVPEKRIVIGGNYVHELSDDLKTIINKQTYYCHNLVDTYFELILEYSKRLPIKYILHPNDITANLLIWAWGWSDFSSIEEIYEDGRISIQAEILSNNGDSLYIQSYECPGTGCGYFGSFRKILFSGNAIILSEDGTQQSPKALKRGMRIDITARRLSEDTLTLLAPQIQILAQDNGPAQ